MRIVIDLEDDLDREEQQHLDHTLRALIFYYTSDARATITFD